MFLEYGVNQHNELVHIEQASRGLTELICPYCGGALLARKGEVKIHHFAHAEETCREVSGRDDNLLRLPFYDKFDLGLSPKEVKYLHLFHDDSYEYMNPRIERDLRDNLEAKGFIHHNPFAGRGGSLELTHLGKIPVGAATLQKFAELQLDRMFTRYNELEALVRQAWKGKKHLGAAPQYRPDPNFQANPENIEAALTDLNIYRAQIKRVFGAKLYFLEIEHVGGKLYKAGMSSRELEERIEELRRDLAPHLDNVKIGKPFLSRSFAHRGSIEFYFKHRYKNAQHRLGSLTEYFTFEDRRQVLSDLSRMGDYEPAGWIQLILDGKPSYIESDIKEESQRAETQAREQAARESHRQATKEGMSRAAEQGIHVGRPEGSKEDNAKFLAKYAEVVEYLEDGDWSLREISYETGVAINTIRKVKATLDAKL